MKFGILVLSFILLFEFSRQHSVTPRISNSKKAELKQFSFMASIQYSYLKLFPYIHICCGVVIDKHWILSTAVCVKEVTGFGSARVMIDMHFGITDPNIPIMLIEDKIIHQQFDGSRTLKWNNVGLLKLEKEISNPVLVKFPQSEEEAKGKVFIIGWGLIDDRVSFDSIPDEVHYATTKIITNQECQKILFNSRPPTYARLDGSMVCTLSYEQPITACEGDAGGPLINYRDNEPVVQGIISWAPIPCGTPNSPTIAMRVFDYIAWINKTMTEGINQTEKEPIKAEVIETETSDLLATLLRSE